MDRSRLMNYGIGETSWEAVAIINTKKVRMVAFISVMVEMLRKEFNFESRGNSICRVIGYKEYTIMICSPCLSYLSFCSYSLFGLGVDLYAATQLYLKISWGKSERLRSE